MPSTSWKQARMMERAARDPEYAAERHVSVDVAEEFHREDLAANVYFDSAGKLVPEFNPPSE